MKRSLSENGVKLITSFEGCRLKAYKCLTSEKYYTIGYGHYGADVTKDMEITKEQAIELFVNDCIKFEDKVNAYMPKYNFNQNQFDALVSFAYNVGNIKKLTADGTRTIEEISVHMLDYVKSGGLVINGLVKRRAKERELFNTPVKSNEELAREVLDGKWGNNEARKKALTNAGYDYYAVQHIVNKILKG